MNKNTDPKPKYPKGVEDLIRQCKQLERQNISLIEGCNKQGAEVRRIAKEAAIVNREVKKHQDEIKRLKYNLRNILP
jgi:hypothetical protein